MSFTRSSCACCIASTNTNQRDRFVRGYLVLRSGSLRTIADAPGTSASEAELQNWVRRHLAAFKTPVRVLFMDETLPRNANGKILKRDLKPLFEDAQ